MKQEHYKKFIFICTGSDCKKSGSKKLNKKLKSDIKSGGLQSAMDVIATKCMGECKKGPNIIINNCMYHKVKEQDLEGILSRKKLPLS